MVSGQVTFVSTINNVETEVMCAKLHFKLEWITELKDH